MMKSMLLSKIADLSSSGVEEDDLQEILGFQVNNDRNKFMLSVFSLKLKKCSTGTRATMHPG